MVGVNLCVCLEIHKLRSWSFWRPQRCCVESISLDVILTCMFLSLTSCASGMDILNGAIDSLISSSNKEDWTPVALNVADATVTISKDKVRCTLLLQKLYSPFFAYCRKIQ